LDEAQVISQVQTGATEAFGEIVEHYQAPIVRYLSWLTGDTEVARDLVQDTFVQAYKGILKTRSELHFKGWLYRIATNNALQ
jgi:RNA polymerase sigma-70 factor (ECF subfamily)|tara:strand:- start:223 stop:468 length:246 start_codon:yes stop_codon:yes gene_type:complete